VYGNYYEGNTVSFFHKLQTGAAPTAETVRTSDGQLGVSVNGVVISADAALHHRFIEVRRVGLAATRANREAAGAQALKLTADMHIGL
jgi:F0F1-type ATP synthase epsilon subunit